jgi:hypothetical protein
MAAVSADGVLDEATLRLALSDPGVYVPRESGQALYLWQVAAVQRLLERHAEEFEAVTGMPLGVPVWLPGDEEPERGAVYAPDGRRYEWLGHPDQWRLSRWRGIVRKWSSRTWYGAPLPILTWQRVLAEVGWVTDLSAIPHGCNRPGERPE